MTYLLAGTVFVAAVILAACTTIYVARPSFEDGQPQPLNIQTTDSVNVMGTQSVTSSDRASREGAGGNVDNTMEGTTVPTIALPPVKP